MGEQQAEADWVDGADTARGRAETDWPLRPWLFAALLALAGLAIFLLTDDAHESGPRIAGAAFIAFAAGGFVFTAERGRLLAAAIFSLVTGLVVGGLTWRAVGAGNDIADSGYAVAAGVFACLLAVPLFQADFLQRRMRTDYRDIHYFVWTDAITGAGAFAFFLIAWALIWLLASLFDLVGIPLRDLVQADWFGWVYGGLTLGAGLGTLRNQLRIIGTLQSVVLLVLSILALPLAIAIAVFLGAVVVSGPSVLWNATDSATTVLLSIAIGAYMLANAVLRDRDADMIGGAVLKWSGYALMLGILPLTVFAAISTGVRIDQHGLSPERLWALCSIIVAVAFGLAYFVDALVGVLGSWRDRLRASNLRLGLATALFALFLALPILNVGAISTSDQLARLESGAISLEEFDFSALRWDFGEPGRQALERLAKSERTRVAELAQNTLQLESKPYGSTNLPEREEISQKADLSGLNDETARAVRAFLRDEIILCREGCRVETLRASPEGVLIALMTKAEYGDNPHLLWVAAGSDKAETRRVYDGKLIHEYEGLDGPVEYDGDIELRPFEGQQIFVDGKPASQPFK